MNKTISSRLSENNSCQFRKIAGNGFRLAVEVTRKCNFKCKHCFVEYEVLDIDKEKLFEILEIAVSLGCKKAILTGGEPLMNKDLISIIRKCTSLGILTDVNSNLYLLNKELTEEMKGAGVGEVSVSLYGNEKTHDDLTQKNGSFNKTVEGIKLLKNNNIPIDIHSIIWEDNLDDLLPLAKLSEELGAESLTFFKVLQPSSQSNGLTANEFKLSNEKIINKIDFSRSKVKIPIRLIGLRDLTEAECQMGQGILGLDVNLQFSPCLLAKSKNTAIDLNSVDFTSALKILNKQILDNVWEKKCRNYY